MHRSRLTIAVLVLTPASLLLASLLLAGDESADRIVAWLKQHQRLVPRGAHGWVLIDEVQWRQRLTHLPDQVDRIAEIQRDLHEKVDANRQLWQAAQPRIKALHNALNGLPSDAPGRPALVRRLEEIESRFVPPDQLGGRADVQPLLIELSTLRNSIALDIFWLTGQIPILQRTYHRCQGDQKVMRALRQLGGEQEVAPIKDDFVVQQRRLDELARQVLTESSPIYLQAGRIRIGGVVNESQALTFTWTDSGETTRLTSAMAEAAGLEVAADSPSVRLRLGSREVLARRIEVESLRFGSCLLRSVVVDVMEPDGEDLGAQIGPAAFEGYITQCLPSQLRLMIRPASDGSPGR
jgi:hypothetical protein